MNVLEKLSKIDLRTEREIERSLSAECFNISAESHKFKVYDYIDGEVVSKSFTVVTLVEFTKYVHEEARDFYQDTLDYQAFQEILEDGKIVYEDFELTVYYSPLLKSLIKDTDYSMYREKKLLIGDVWWEVQY